MFFSFLRNIGSGQSGTFCPTGFTFGFWYRALYPIDKDISKHYISMIGQAGGGPNIGFDIFLGIDNRLVFENYSYKFICDYSSQGLDVLWRKWNFIALTFKKSEEKFYCIFNDQPLVVALKIPEHQERLFLHSNLEV